MRRSHPGWRERRGNRFGQLYACAPGWSPKHRTPGGRVPRRLKKTLKREMVSWRWWPLRPLLKGETSRDESRDFEFRALSYRWPVLASPLPALSIYYQGV